MLHSNRLLKIFLALVVCTITNLAFSQNPIDVFTLDNRLRTTLNLEDDLDNFSLLRINNSKAAYESFRVQNTTFKLKLPIDASTSVEVELAEQNIFSDNFSVIEKTPNGDRVIDFEKPLHYRGTVIGQTTSSVGFTISKDQLYGVLAFGGNNYNIELNTRNSDGDYYILYKQADFKHPLNFECSTEDGIILPTLPSTKPSDNTSDNTRNAAPVNIYVECDYQMYLENNSNTSMTTTYATNLFNMVAGLYSSSASTTINLSQVVVWSMPDPYSAENLSSSQLLSLFECQHADGGYNGRIAHILTTASIGGGIANRPSGCPDNGTYNNPVYGVSGIGNNFNSNLSVYSWDINVFAHELGHQFSSPHTHACSWGPNGNTPIDCCGNNAGYGECGCTIGVPNPKGTIMSYCHLTSTDGNSNGNPGIDLTLGFHAEVAAKIQNFAACLSSDVEVGCPVPAPEEITFSNITNTSVTVTTTATGDIFAYSYLDLESGDFECVVCSGLSAGNTEVEISGLSPCKTYAISISALCFSTNTWSPWSSFFCGDVSFMTTGPSCSSNGLGDGVCRTSITVEDSDIPGATGIFRAATTIETDGNTVAVGPSETVSFLAGNSVTLNPGFYAQSGSAFLADIENCSPTLQENIPVDALAKINNGMIENEQPQIGIKSSIQLSIQPNPFTNSTMLHFTTLESQKISLMVFNLNGQLVDQIIQDQPREKGLHTINYDASTLGEGLFQLILKTDKSIHSKKMIVLK